MRASRRLCRLSPSRRSSGRRLYRAGAYLTPRVVRSPARGPRDLRANIPVTGSQRSKRRFRRLFEACHRLQKEREAIPRLGIAQANVFGVLPRLGIAYLSKEEGFHSSDRRSKRQRTGLRQPTGRSQRQSTGLRQPTGRAQRQSTGLRQPTGRSQRQGTGLQAPAGRAPRLRPPPERSHAAPGSARRLAKPR